VEVRECLLSFGAEYFVFQFAIKNLKIKIYRSTILSVVLYGCETWSLTLRKNLRLRLYENRVSRRIFGPKSNEVTEKWRKVHNEEHHELYFSPNIIRVIKSKKMRGAGHVAHMGIRDAYTGFEWENLRKRDNLTDPFVDGKIILRWISRKSDVGEWTGST
jgi:hypothetical protein